MRTRSTVARVAVARVAVARVAVARVAVARSAVAPHARVALLALAALPLAGCAALLALLSGNLHRPTLTLRSVDVTSISLAGLTANFVFDAQNPNTFRLDLARFDYQLTLDGHALAAGVANQGFSLPPSGTGTLTVPLSVAYADAGQALVSLFQKRELPYSIHTTLGFNSPVGVVNVPVDHQSTFPVPRLPDLSLEGSPTGGVSYSGANVALAVTLKNPNSFALPLGALHYAIQAAGVSVGDGNASPGTLSPNGQSVLSIPVHIDFLRAGAAVVSAVRTGRIDLGFDGALDLGVGGQSLPYHATTTVAFR